MRKAHKRLEHFFEKITSIATAILSNSITFMMALSVVLFWIFNRDFKTQSINDIIEVVIQGVWFLSLFIIQKSFGRFAGSLQLKLNELVASHETANNAVLNVEHKTEQEIKELSKEYTELANQLKDLEDNAP